MTQPAGLLRRFATADLQTPRNQTGRAGVELEEISKARFGQTLGKRLLGIRVVRESGARISIGQSIVRQLPVVFQVFWIDVLFALFTDRSQRAFELLSKTRVVTASPRD